MIVFLAGLMLAAFASPALAAVNAVVDSSWTSWPNTVYYFARLSGPNASYSDIKVHVTAVDRYAIWINGNRIDTPAKNDGKWETVEHYDVAVTGADIFVAVQVDNLGIGNGNGLMVDIDAGADWLGTTTMKRRSQYKDNTMTLYPAVWYYYAGDVKTALKKTDWYKFDAKFFDDAVKLGLKPVMLGKMGTLQNYTPDSHIEIVAGYEGDIDVGGEANGGMKLRRIEGENLALAKPADAERLVDGDLAQGFQYQQDPMGSTKKVDLVRNYRVNKLVMYTGGTNPNDFPRVSVRGYSAEISLDNYRFEEVGTIQEIGIMNRDSGGYEYSEVSFPPQITRYVRYKINATRLFMPIVGEMMIYGQGYTYEGMYTSPWYDFGSATAMKNIQGVTWDGEVPEGTKIEVQTRTLRAENVAPSDWSPVHTEKSFEFDSPEPALKVQYRVRLLTSDPEKTPKVKSVKISFSKDNQPLVSGRGSIVPKSVPMNADTSFAYTLSYKLATGMDIKTVVISVPNYSKVSSVSLVKVEDNNSKTTVKTMAETTDFTYSSKNDSLYVTFVNPVTDAGGKENQLLINFRTKLLTNVHEFSSGVIGSMLNDGAGPLRVWEDPDFRWIVSTNSIMEEMLMQVKAVPKVFTPNNDSKNDFTVLEFTLAKAQTRVKINIFSTNGTLVRVLHDGVLSPTAYIDDNAPGRWDGKNDDGDLVPPGIYMFQVIADTDDGDKVETGTVVVAY